MATYNAFDPAARALYWKQANEGLFKYGIDAWWCDSTEPFEPDWHGTVKPEPWQRLMINTNDAKTYLDPTVINAYSLLHSQGIYEGQRSVTTEKRVVNLTRSYYPRSAALWNDHLVRRYLRNVGRVGAADCRRPEFQRHRRGQLDGGYWRFLCRSARSWFWRGEYPDGHLDDLATGNSMCAGSSSALFCPFSVRMAPIRRVKSGVSEIPAIPCMRRS